MFSLSEAVTKFQTSDKRSFPPVDNASSELNSIIEALAVSPEQLNANPEVLETLIDLCQAFPHLSVKLQTQLVYLVNSCLSNLCSEILSNLNANNDEEVIEMMVQWKALLEEYGYLVYVLLSFLQEDVHIAASQTSSNLARSHNKQNATTVELFKRTCNQIESVCETVLKLFKINLSKFFTTTPERDLFIGLFTRPLYVLIEVEAVTKVSSLKMFIQQIIAIAVNDHEQASSAHNAIMTNLTYFLHLSNFNAELLHILDSQFNRSKLTEEILRDISSRIFNSKDTTGPKAISNFLIKLSELSPHIMLRQMSLVIRLLNNSSITLRCSVVEACGNIATDLMKNDEDFEHYRQQVYVLIELLQERFQDSNPFVRTKAIQGCLKICDMSMQLNKIKLNFTKLAARSLQDRSSLVRRNAVKLLSKLLLKHPFSTVNNGSQLKLQDWEKNLQLTTKELDNLAESQERNIDALQASIESNDRDLELDDLNSSEHPHFGGQSSGGDDANTIIKIRLLQEYYKDAIEFIKIIHRSIDLSSNLLFSKNRNEVLETMDFLVLTDAYDLEPSAKAIKQMLHLVWMKGATDEGTSISAHLISCYQRLFLTTPESYNYKERAAHIATNLIQLTIGASVADLASLEQLLGMMYRDDLIDDNVVNVLWGIYSSISNSSSFKREQVHGAVIVLGMLALANHEIALRGLDSLLTVGLGPYGAKDLVLCRYTCVVLERMTPKKDISATTSSLGNKHEEDALKKLYANIIQYTEDVEFYPMCEQAISALFTISSKPDIICTELVKEKTMMTFGQPQNSELHSHKEPSRIVALSQLLFIVGQVSIKILVYLEKCEAEFKKRKVEAETRKTKEKEETEKKPSADGNPDISQDNELAMIGGTNEDDFMDATAFIRENDLLFGENSLLGKFCPLVEDIVSNNSRYSDPMLQRTATLCLQKLMCVSSKYCEKSLPLLITVMEKSPDPIIRSNAVLGLGDMAVCFNNLVDENTDYLYRRLHDENLMVQRTCLMTVTFLILAGQVKVKGQLGEMAKCLENPDQGISDMCRLFFSELATKDNAIYNGFIDIFSNLSSDKDLEQESFKRIMKFLLSFIEKEKHQKQLSEKLMSRLARCGTEGEWNDIAFVLHSLPYKDEEVTNTLAQGFKAVSAKE